MKFISASIVSAVVGFAFSATAFAADINKPECVAPAKPGGGFDVTCRVAQTGLKDAFDKPIQVTFMPGGIGAVAINMFNTTRTDDPNAIVAFSSGSLLNMATGKYGQWGADDVRFLATVGADYGAVIVRADSPYKTLDDLMAAAKENLPNIVFGAGGSVGSQDWMKAALLLKSEDLDARKMRYVAFDGGGAAMAGLLGGAIQVYTGDVSDLVSHMDSGDIRVLAILSKDRLDAPFDKFPTAKEQGYDAEWIIMRGFYMGKNVSDEAYNKWVEAFKAAYKTDEFAQVQKDKGLLPLNMAGEELQVDAKARVAKMADIARETGLIK